MSIITCLALLLFLGDMSFTGFPFNIVVRCGFDKHLCLTSCLDAHNHNTHTFAPNRLYCGKNYTLHY